MRLIKRLVGVALGTALLAALAIGTSAGAQEESRKLNLTPSRDSGVSGTATFKDTKSGTEVALSITGAPEGGVDHLAHIHEGATCEDDRNDRGGPVEFPLEPIRAGDDGTGSSTTTIKDTSVAQLFTTGKERYVNVHAKAEGGGVPPGIACADLTSTSGGNTAGEDTAGGRQNATKLPKSGGGTSPIAPLFAGAALAAGAIAGFLALRRRTRA
jgi:LPXTG-motif cell wall-anchored protein